MLIFISSVSREDACCETLEKHLSPLLRQEDVTLWHNGKRLPGDDLRAADKLAAADIILCLLSADYLASCNQTGEPGHLVLPFIDGGTARVIPILVRDSDRAATPFAHLQALPAKGKAVARFRSADEAWAEIAIGIRELVETIRADRRIAVTALVDDAEGATFYLQSRVFNFVNPVRCCLDLAAGTFLQRVLAKLARERGPSLLHPFRPLQAEFLLAFDGKRLASEHSLRDQQVSAGVTLELWIELRPDPDLAAEPGRYIVMRGDPAEQLTMEEERLLQAIVQEIREKGLY